MKLISKTAATTALCCALASVSLFAEGAIKAGMFFSEGPRGGKVLALTFDDGPGPNTGKVLEILKRYNVRGTFFMEGSQVASRPNVAREVVEAGHEVGSHTYSHINFYTYAKDDYQQVLLGEMQKTNRLLLGVTGSHPVLIRMPHGYVRTWVKEIAGRENQILVNWTYGSDWKKQTPAQLAENYIKNIKPGAILLMHDGGGKRDTLLAALPSIIEAIQRQGYTIVPVGELLGVNGQGAPQPQGLRTVSEKKSRRR